ncbi:MAG: helix-turn-helix transcriptional regulator [Desulfobacterales bacterium]|jgi:transcriptional regulator with XRE-family HTH domain|nr:helix-turn-helix transcriptional regulator [Desulfobacterales bacterium]
MEDIKLMSDGALLEALGRRLSRRRLDLQLTQAKLAEQAGVSKRTVERIETGAAAQTLSLIRILRVLDLLQGLDQLVPEPGSRPMELLKLKGKQRKRASSGKTPERPKTGWSWGDDS